MILSRSSVASVLAAVLVLCLSTSAHGQDRYDVVWDSPSADYSGTMPLGNGDIGLNAWINAAGELIFYIGKTDSWGDNGRLLKVGRVRIALEPSPRIRSKTFEQTLHLATATMEARFGEGDETTTVRVWVDAYHPVIHVTIDSPDFCEATAYLEPWRVFQDTLSSIEVSDVHLNRSREDGQHAPTVVEPDTFLPSQIDRIGWYHHNSKSVGPELTARMQGLADFDRPDPLLGRTFGGVVKTDFGLRSSKDTLVASQERSHHFRIYVHTQMCDTPFDWFEAMNELIEKTEALDFEEMREKHEGKWRRFWDRSWIDVESAEGAAKSSFVPVNEHPVQIGIDQHGGNAFAGEIGRVSIVTVPVGEADAEYLALEEEPALDAPEILLYSGTAATPLSLEDSAGWDLSGGFSVEAFVKPSADATGGGRIVDKITPGGDDGFLLDTHPGLGLRLITAMGTLHVENALKADEWNHVTAVADPEAGKLFLYLDGALLEEMALEAVDDAYVVSRGYALQRFIDAAAGNGGYPIKFNGSIFTVPYSGKPGNADYRRWGPGYWWQNTRLPYLSMCASGDSELMRPLFKMYAEDLMPLFVHRTQKYFGHEGAFIPECIYFWGDVFSETYGWTPFEEREDKLQQSGWHKWEWVSGLELVWMMLDYCDHTQNDAFLTLQVLPTAKEILKFFDQHYAVDEAGKLVMHPSQAVETWWDCTNPMPEVAGLIAITERLLALPKSQTNEWDREFWTQLQAKLPALPLREVEGVSMLAPAERFADKRNIENPELYAVFPFRLVSFEKQNAALGRAALEHRWDRGHFGWRQDDLFMAYLGLAEQARANLVKRARSHDPESRFPAFWGPNYDWTPDQDHGGVLMRALQVMLMQTEGRTIHLLPAWPKDWNARFKLHAPYRTIVEGEVRDGELHGLQVTPQSRSKDVVVHEAQ